VQKGSAPSATDALLGIGINAGMAYGSASMGQQDIANVKSGIPTRGSSALPSSGRANMTRAFNR